jgi:D-alanine-D-alanine ligase
VPGEIRTPHDFYDYDAKYRDQATELLVPAPVSDEQAQTLQRLACDAFRALEGSGLGRVDFFVERSSGEIFVNEVNSLPGFTEGSMFPRLWEASGLSYPALIDRLVELALERHRGEARLETHYRPG